MTFQTLANLAIEQEKIIQQGDHSGESVVEGAGTSQPTPNALTQDDINEFVMRKMGQEKSGHRTKGHSKRPSQEEINEYVVHQMRKEQQRTTRIRSQSQPEPRSQHHEQRLLHSRCGFCGDPHHRLSHCWRRWRVAAEEPQANFVPKRIEFRTEVPGQPPMYRTGFFLS